MYMYMYIYIYIYIYIYNPCSACAWSFKGRAGAVSQIADAMQ